MRVLRWYAVTFVFMVLAAAVGAKRTVACCGCPGARLKLPPDTVLNGALTTLR